MELGIGAIGGKDSMSGSFEELDVPPTLISFAVTTSKTDNIVSNEFKKAGNEVILLSPEYGDDGLPKAESLIALFGTVHELLSSGRAVSAYTPGCGGVAEAVLKMCLGNGFGFEYSSDMSLDDIFGYRYGSFLLEMNGEVSEGRTVGVISDRNKIVWGENSIPSLTPMTPCSP